MSESSGNEAFKNGERRKQREWRFQDKFIAHVGNHMSNGGHVNDGYHCTIVHDDNHCSRDSSLGTCDGSLRLRRKMWTVSSFEVKSIEKT